MAHVCGPLNGPRKKANSRLGRAGLSAPMEFGILVWLRKYELTTALARLRERGDPDESGWVRDSLIFYDPGRLRPQHLSELPQRKLDGPLFPTFRLTGAPARLVRLAPIGAVHSRTTYQQGSGLCCIGGSPWRWLRYCSSADTLLTAAPAWVVLRRTV